MLRIVAVVGYKKSGKTAVTEGLVRELIKRGYRVCTIKHVREREFTIDQRGKDTWRHAQAGANPVICIAPREVATITRRAAKLHDVIRALRGIDFVIVEGFRGAKGITKVAVARSGAEAKKLADEFTIACIGHRKLWLPVFRHDEVRKLADLVEQKALPLLPELDCRHCGHQSCREFALAVLSGRERWNGCPTLRERVTLTIDGKQVHLNPFMQTLIAGVIDGMLSTMKGTKGGQIELRVRRHAR
ncbi:MAG: molybdopterin-guanine dinucleotide biosynthesis protein B [Candidatus Hodarchaeaceae archaeon]|nr:molybdopterin-guanine dinucleotide biosynthesis protein B [Candidatus Hodarchaeaceae archaeon]